MNVTGVATSVVSDASSATSSREVEKLNSGSADSATVSVHADSAAPSGSATVTHEVSGASAPFDELTPRAETTLTVIVGELREGPSQSNCSLRLRL